MGNWYINLTAIEKLYFYAAVIGGCLFMVRMVMMLLGGDHGDSDGHVDMDHGGDVHADGADVHADHGHASSDASFKLLSLQGLTAFFAFFGLSGLALTLEFKIADVASLIGAFAVGFGSMYAVAKLFQLFLGLQSSGTLSIQNAIGQEGTVYLTIPSGGVGKVQITIQDRLKEFNAVAEGKKQLKTGDRVRVTEVTSGAVLKVEKT